MSLSANDLAFLRELQTELNTQDTVCQADPRFWVVRQDRWRDAENSVDRIDIVSDEDCELAGVDDALESAWSAACEHMGEAAARHLFAMHGVDPESETVSEKRAIELIERCIDEFKIPFTLYPMERYRANVDDTLFLTLRECQEHIAANHYHYEHPAPYAMTAWRSPQFERLIKILQTAEFSGSEDE